MLSIAFFMCIPVIMFFKNGMKTRIHTQNKPDLFLRIITAEEVQQFN